VNSVALRSLPFHEPDRLVMLEEKWLPRFPRFETSPLDFLSWKAECQSYVDMAAFAPVFFNLSEGDQPERIAGARVNANLPGLLGVSPILGRGFTAEEDRAGANQVALLGHSLWQRRFGADPQVIGRAVRMNGVAFTVVGVMPPEFRFPLEAEIWMPMGFTPDEIKSRNDHFIRRSQRWTSLCHDCSRTGEAGSSRLRTTTSATFGSRSAYCWERRDWSC
jgi:hypothetical protein